MIDHRKIREWYGRNRSIGATNDVNSLCDEIDRLTAAHAEAVASGGRWYTVAEANAEQRNKAEAEVSQLSAERDQLREEAFAASQALLDADIARARDGWVDPSTACIIRAERDQLSAEMVEARKTIAALTMQNGDMRKRLERADRAIEDNHTLGLDNERLRAEVERLTHARDNIARRWEADLANLEAGWAREAALASQVEGLRGAVRPQVWAFAVMMEKELRANDHKGGWSEMTADALLDRLEEEVAELFDAVSGNTTGIGSEAADVANFAMMVADVSRALLATPREP